MEIRNTHVQVLIMGEPSTRLMDVLQYMFKDITHTYIDGLADIQLGPIVFAAALDHTGVNLQAYALIRQLRQNGECLRGCVGGVLIDGESELYTRFLAREIIFCANGCGCAFVGSPLVEGTGSLYNFTLRAKIGHMDRFSAYLQAARELAERLKIFQKPNHEHHRILALYASNRNTSNTLSLWGMVKGFLDVSINVREISLRNGEVADCEACPYTACLHLGEQGTCFYGGIMVEEVYPALLQSEAVVLLCPNYNDGIDANMAAFVNRLTALFRTNSFVEKMVFSIIVSGYSGGDILARQVISGMNINKGFLLPPRFCMMETANDPGSIVQSPGIESRAAAYAKVLNKWLMEP